MSEWSVEKTEDIREVDAKKKPAAKAPFEKPEEEEEGKHLPGREKGSAGEFEDQPDQDQEAAP
jgi:hypothetical protein